MSSPRVDETPQLAGGKACVSFFANDPSPARKTKTWEVWSLHDARHVGQVRWYPRWRRYCFFPAAGIAMDRDRLRSIAEFVESESEKHRKGKRAF